MRLLNIIFILVFSSAVLGACNNDQKAPKSDNNNMAAQLSPEIQYIEDQIVMLNRLADQLEQVQSMADAQKLKSSIANEYITVFGLDGSRAEQFDQNELARLLAKDGRLQRQMEALKRIGLGMARLSSENQDAYIIVAQEINKIYKAAR